MPVIVLIITFYQKNHLGFYRLLLDKIFAEYEIHLMVSDYMVLDFDDFKNVKLYTLNSHGESHFGFFLRNLKVLRKADVLVYEEIYKFKPIYILLLIFYGSKTHLIVHNAHKWLNRGKAKSTQDFVKNGIFLAVKKAIGGIIVVSQSVREYIKDNNLFAKTIHYFPFSSFSENPGFNSEKPRGAEIIFTIPGTINTQRRNYALFLRAFLKLIGGKISVKVRLVLLGRIIEIGKEEGNLIKQINSLKKDTVLYWEEYIDDETFEHWLLNTDYLIGNVNINYTENRIAEVYGRSKETGILFAMMKYKKPTLFPENYFVSDIYNGLAMRYPNNLDSLVDYMVKLLEESFTVDKNVADRHESLVNEQMDSFKRMVFKNRR